MITVEQLKSSLNYDPNTGIFTRKCKSECASHGEVAGYIDEEGYRRIRVCGRKYKAHRLAWLYVYGGVPECQIDHANGDPGDNRIGNLRLVSGSQNKQNSSIYSNNTSGFKGVSWMNVRGPKWRASLRVNGKSIHVGYYETPKEAHSAYVEAAKKYYGDFARKA